MARTKLESRQRYLDSESEAGKRLQEFVDAEPPGIMAQEIALARYMASEAVRNGQPVLAKDCLQMLGSLLRTSTSLRVLHGELVPRADVDKFCNRIGEILSDVAKRHLPEGFEALCDDFAEAWHEAEQELIDAARKQAPRRIKLQ